MKKDYQDTVRLDFSDNDLKRMIKSTKSSQDTLGQRKRRKQWEPFF